MAEQEAGDSRDAIERAGERIAAAERLEFEGENLSWLQGEHLLVSCGFSLHEIQYGMTLTEFKAHIFIAMRNKLEAARQQADALALAIGSVLSKEVGEISQDIRTKVNHAIEELDGQTRELFGLPSSVNTSRLGEQPSRTETATSRPEPASSEAEKQSKVMKLVQKLDAGFEKLTGKRSGAPWAAKR